MSLSEAGGRRRLHACGQRRSQEMDLSGSAKKKTAYFKVMAAIIPLECAHLVRLPISPLAPLHPYINSEKRWFKHPSPGLRSTGTQSPFPDGQPDWQVQQVQSQPCLQNTQTLSPKPSQTTDTIHFLQFPGKSSFARCPFPLYQF